MRSFVLSIAPRSFQTKARVRCVGRRPVFYQTPESAKWVRAAVNALRVMNDGEAPFEGPLAVALAFFVEQSATETPLHKVRLDVDNAAKLSLDCLKTAGVFVDDAQVCELRVAKAFGEERIEITVCPLEEWQSVFDQ
jgi:Holliday junction resolvase RusA-like endonuclease